MDIYQIAKLRPRERYREFLRVPALSAGVYVPPRVEHRFHSITEELRLLVVFAPAETSPA